MNKPAFILHSLMKKRVILGTKFYDIISCREEGMPVRKSIGFIELIIILCAVVIIANFELYKKENFKPGLKIKPVSPEAYKWCEKGYKFYCHGEFGNALHCYDEALKINPTYIDAWEKKGWLKRKSGQI